MKLVAKVAASVASLALLAMAGDAWLDQRQRVDLLQMDVLKDWRVGRVLQANVEALWRKGGEEDARLVVETTDKAVPNRMIQYVPLDELEPADLRLELPWTRRREDVAWRYLADGNGDEMRYLYIPLAAPDGTVRAAIVVGESLAPLDAHLRGRLMRKAALGTSVVGLSGLLAVLLGVWLVERPVAGLRSAVRGLGTDSCRRRPGRAGAATSSERWRKTCMRSVHGWRRRSVSGTRIACVPSVNWPQASRTRSAPRSASSGCAPA